MRRLRTGSAVPLRSRPAGLEREWRVRAGPGAPGPRGGNAGESAQRDGAPRSPRRPPPVLRLESFQSRGAASLRSALAESSSRCGSGSSSLRPPRLPQAAGERASPLAPSPSSRSFPANFPEPRPAAQSSPAASGPTADCGRRARLCPVSHPCAPGALRRERDDARGWGPRQSPGEMAGHWAFGARVCQLLCKGSHVPMCHARSAGRVGACLAPADQSTPGLVILLKQPSGGPLVDQHMPPAPSFSPAQHHR
ncbi:sodium channel subunit beta-4 isoform X4 [Nycticebus coucang]|uniref:sodium channel subunit beta-4 isoform X4 n=1 Tax=Nycticebus coucang TaxID=9470 RepID=UPI00234D590C|nr:sodium channel subunit beta-4 isoform X4 [Nycticebus coucang]